MTLAPYPRKGRFVRAQFDADSYQKHGVEVVVAYSNAGAPSNGPTGTLAGIAEPGALLIDTTNKTMYQNSNTRASPTWTIFTTASGSGAFTGTFNGTVGATTPNTGKFTLVSGSVADGLTASATQTRTGGLALTAQHNRVTTSATNGNAVTLANLDVTQFQEVWNHAAANSIQVFPNLGTDTIDAGGAGASVTLVASHGARFLKMASGKLYSHQLGATAA